MLRGLYAHDNSRNALWLITKWPPHESRAARDVPYRVQTAEGATRFLIGYN
jgi:hypothetical protein